MQLRATAALLRDSLNHHQKSGRKKLIAMKSAGSELDLGLLLGMFFLSSSSYFLFSPPALLGRLESTSARHQREDLNNWYVTGWHHAPELSRQSACGLFVKRSPNDQDGVKRLHSHARERRDAGGEAEFGGGCGGVASLNLVLICSVVASWGLSSRSSAVTTFFLSELCVVAGRSHPPGGFSFMGTEIWLNRKGIKECGFSKCDKNTHSLTVGGDAEILLSEDAVKNDVQMS